MYITDIRRIKIIVQVSGFFVYRPPPRLGTNASRGELQLAASAPVITSLLEATEVCITVVVIFGLNNKQPQ